MAPRSARFKRSGISALDGVSGKNARKPTHDLVHDKSTCVMCRDRHAFIVPDHLLKQLSKQNVVIFAGAGVSTETASVFPWSLYDEIHESLGLAEDNKPAFSKLMSLYCARPDGRRELLERVRARLAYIRGFPEIYRAATRFHRELSTLFYVDTYVTTNWDDFFERECGATPLVNAEDFVFWNVGGRKVFKLHGSVSNFGSVIATDEDYRQAQRQLERGTLGSALKLMLATKTIVYVGYSFSDYDFLNIHRYISRELKEIAPVAYIVSLDQSARDRFKKLGLTPIFTDAAHFVQVLKRHFEADGHYLPDARLDDIPFALSRAQMEHDRLHRTLNVTANPEIIYSACYQDGLIHAFERILSRSHAGDYSHKCTVALKVQKYNSMRKENLHARRYLDAAYIEGYMNALVYLLSGDEGRAHLPFYFVCGVDRQPVTLAEYKKAVKASGRLNKKFKLLAKRIVREQLGPGDDLHHTPFLTWRAESAL